MGTAFGQKLQQLEAVTVRLEDTEEKLGSQTTKLQNLVKSHEHLINDNRFIHNEHNELTNRYKSLVSEYEAAIVEQQTILSNTLLAVANLHKNGSEQIHSLLREMSDVTSNNKEVAINMGKSFTQVDTLRDELQ